MKKNIVIRAKSSKSGGTASPVSSFNLTNLFKDGRCYKILANLFMCRNNPAASRIIT